MSKVKRTLPEMGSRPTEANSMPTTTRMKPLVKEDPDRVTARRSPTSVREKYSGGPKSRANSESGGAKNVRPRTAREPAMNEPMAAMPRAAPALPFFAIWYPSRQVTTDAASPGRLRRTEVVDPPYIEP